MKHPTIDKLSEMKLFGMQEALLEQEAMSDIDDLSFLERFGLLVDREQTARSNRSLTRRIQRAKFRIQATIEDVDFRSRRGLDRSQFLALANGQWINDRLNVLITGAAGTGKTHLACALGQKACRDGHSVQYKRVPRFLPDLRLAEADGRYPRLMSGLAKTRVLILDDIVLAPMKAQQRHDLLEILEDRHELTSTIVTSQLPVESWYEAFGDATIADAILDRLVHGSYRFELTGESIRKKKARKRREK